MQRSASRNHPSFVIHLGNLAKLCLGKSAVIKIPYYLFQKVVHGNYSQNPTVFIQNHCKMLSAGLHPAEKNIGPYAARHKIGRTHGLFHNVIQRSVRQTEIIFGIQNSLDIIGCFTANRILRITALSYRLVPLIKALLLPKEGYICAVCGKFADRHIVKLKDILDHLFLTLIDDTLFTAGINHHAYLFFADMLLFGIRINANEPQNSVS